MELLLIRHAQPVTRIVSDGVADPELSEMGRKQADLLADYLSSERIDALYSSPMRRAQETALPIAASQGLDIITVDGVSEYDREAQEYIPVEEMKNSGDGRWEAFVNSNREHLGSSSVFYTTVTQALDSIVHRHHGHKVAVVCHGGVINVAVAHALGLERGGFFLPQYTSINRLAASRRGHRSIITINEMGHIRGTGLTTGAVHE